VAHPETIPFGCSVQEREIRISYTTLSVTINIADTFQFSEA